MSRNYTLPTIKMLFGEASACAYPDCGEPLIFADRGRKTAIAEIAHIRSESPGGPRYDADYTDDVDGPDNLLLLCGKHHKAVDRHESSYTVAELEMWRAAQRATAGTGTAISETDLRSYVLLTPDDRKVLTDIARLAQRVVGLTTAAQEEIGRLRQMHEEARMVAWSRSGMAGTYSVDEQGTRSTSARTATSCPSSRGTSSAQRSRLLGSLTKSGSGMPWPPWRKRWQSCR